MTTPWKQALGHQSKLATTLVGRSGELQQSGVVGPSWGEGPIGGSPSWAGRGQLSGNVPTFKHCLGDLASNCIPDT